MIRLCLGAACAALLALTPRSGVAQDPTAIADGARLYANNCSRCHNPRAATERTDREWAVIVNHMRVRGMLSRSDARKITTFLQATNLPETRLAGGDSATPGNRTALGSEAEPARGEQPDEPPRLTWQQRLGLVRYIWPRATPLAGRDPKP